VEKKGDIGNEKTLVRDVSFCGVGSNNGSNACAVDVKDNKIIRIRPLHFDWKYTKEEMNPWVMDARGKTFEPSMKTLIPPYSIAYKKRIYSPARIRYPLKRIDFDPNGNRNQKRRGDSKYVRISWKEALDIIEGEIRRIKKQYGMTAILYQSDQHGENKNVHGPHGTARKLLKILGGYTLQVRQPDSWEGWTWGAKHVWGCQPVGQQDPQANLLYDIAQNTELLLFWGCDQETTTWGWEGQLPSRLSYWYSELGIKQIYVAPDLNYAAAVHADKWIPVLPNTDAALYLGIAHVWITEGTYDKEYVRTHTYGFDKFEEYVTGKEDGVPKTPKWAEEITHVPASDIKALAKEWASKRTTVVIGNGGPGIRGPYSTEPARLQVLLLAMQGLGKPGCNQAKMIEWGLFELVSQIANPKPKVLPNLMKAYMGGHPRDTNHPSFIPKTLIHEAILNPPLTWYGNESETPSRENQFIQYRYPAEGCSEVHMIWTDSPCWMTCWNDGNRFIEALKSEKIEFIMAQHPWMENECLFADIILPVNTKFEEEDINSDVFSGQFALVYPEHKCIEPFAESKSDYEITCMIAERMGVLKEYTGGRSVEEIMRLGFDTSGVTDLVSWEELQDKGYFVVPTDPNWKDVPAGLFEFYKDPKKHPLTTPTGLVEFYATGLAENFPDDRERPPVPHWIPEGESHQETIGTARSVKYPLLMESNHPRWKVHANHEDITWIREIDTCKVRGPDGYQYQPVWINPVDAAARGIKSGDVVNVYNERGSVLGGAYVTERVMPGALSMDHGAKVDPIVPGEIDRGGAIDLICCRRPTSKNAVGMAMSGFLVQLEKANLEDLRKKYPEAFSRKFSPSAGPIMETYMAQGGA
jgi:trimethylamine-N-oxide reductase (cytochrome c)